MEPSGRISPLLRMQEHIPPPAERAGRRRRAASPPSRATSPEERPQQQDSWVPDQPVRADSINATGPGGFGVCGVCGTAVPLREVNLCTAARARVCDAVVRRRRRRPAGSPMVGRQSSWRTGCGLAVGGRWWLLIC